MVDCLGESGVWVSFVRADDSEDLMVECTYFRPDIAPIGESFPGNEPEAVNPWKLLEEGDSRWRVHDLDLAFERSSDGFSTPATSRQTFPATDEDMKESKERVRSWLEGRLGRNSSEPLANSQHAHPLLDELDIGTSENFSTDEVEAKESRLRLNQAAIQFLQDTVFMWATQTRSFKF
jgi:hypothetical protein